MNFQNGFILTLMSNFISGYFLYLMFDRPYFNEYILSFRPFRERPLSAIKILFWIVQYAIYIARMFLKYYEWERPLFVIEAVRLTYNFPLTLNVLLRL